MHCFSQPLPHISISREAAILLPVHSRRRKSKGKSQNLLGHVADAEACFQQALEIAHNQAAKSLELRVAMSIARLWQQQGKKQPARQLLKESDSWFSEGFETADLREAKALLGSLSR